jgi:Predicted membrane protein
LADTAQQTVGGFLLAGPFVVTEEVWVLAANMTVWHAVATVTIVAGIGYGALYKADGDRDPDSEAEVAGVPVRFLSLMAVSYGAVALLALAVTAPTTLGTTALSTVGIDDPTSGQVAGVTLKAISVGAIFSVVGAATADSVF